MSEVSVRSQAGVPLALPQAPPQSGRVKPSLGDALNVTVVPVCHAVAHVAAGVQATPGRSLVTEETPAPWSIVSEYCGSFRCWSHGESCVSHQVPLCA